MRHFFVVLQGNTNIHMLVDRKVATLPMCENLTLLNKMESTLFSQSTM